MIAFLICRGNATIFSNYLFFDNVKTEATQVQKEKNRGYWNYNYLDKIRYISTLPSLQQSSNILGVCGPS